MGTISHHCFPHASSPHQRWQPLFAGRINHLRSFRILERAKGFEPSTPTLARLCSTPELHPRPNSGCYLRAGRTIKHLCQKEGGFATIPPRSHWPPRLNLTYSLTRFPLIPLPTKALL